MWYADFTVADRKALHKVERTAEYIIGMQLLTIADLHHQHCVQRSYSIIMDQSLYNSCHLEEIQLKKSIQKHFLLRLNNCSELHISQLMSLWLQDSKSFIFFLGTLYLPWTIFKINLHLHFMVYTRTKHWTNCFNHLKFAWLFYPLLWLLTGLFCLIRYWVINLQFTHL